VKEDIDYHTWPKGEIFERKRTLLERIASDYSDTGEVTENDFNYLWDKSKHFWVLFNHFAESRVQWMTEAMLKDIEIADLRKQIGK
jgi:hypothetical protein